MSQVDFMEQPVRTVLAVAKGLATPNYIKRGRDDQWMALPAKTDKLPKEFVSVPWRQLLMVDVSLAEVATIEPGEEAYRPDCETPWSVKTLPDRQREQAQAVGHDRWHEAYLTVQRHAGALAAYGLLGGLVLLGFAVTAFMLGARIPAWPADQVPWGWWQQVHALWWPTVLAGVALLAGGLWSAAARRGSPALGAAALTALLFAWPLYRHGEWLLGPLVVCGLALVIAWRAVVVAILRWRADRLRRSYEESRSQRAAVRRDHPPRERTVTTAN